jgi:hypothetical protein
MEKFSKYTAWNRLCQWMNICNNLRYSQWILRLNVAFKKQYGKYDVLNGAKLSIDTMHINSMYLSSFFKEYELFSTLALSINKMSNEVYKTFEAL